MATKNTEIPLASPAGVLIDDKSEDLNMSNWKPITVVMEREEETLEFSRLNTALQLLNKLGLGVNDALIIRGDELLTPDRRIHTGDDLVVRTVVSRG